MKTPSTVRVAAAQYSLDSAVSYDDLQRKLDRWVGKAAAKKARLLVFPEFVGMEFVALNDLRRLPDRRSPTRHTLGPLPVIPATRRKDVSLKWETATVQKSLSVFLAVYSELARKYGVYILAGTLPVTQADGNLRNRAYFFAPDGNAGFQDKLVPTRWESECWQIVGGEQICVFDTDFGPVGITICYDVEFPLIARRQTEAGARIVLAPSCCNSTRGFHRVRIGAHARALENQAYVVQAVMVGETEWSSVIGEAVGLAGVYCPPDLGPQVDGVIEQATSKSPQWIFADLDLAAVDRIRGGDDIVANKKQWDSHVCFGKAVRTSFAPAAARDPAAPHRLGLQSAN